MRIGIVVGLLVLGLGGWASGVAADEIERWRQEAATAPLEVRLQAIEALGKSGDLRALPALLTALEDENPTIRERAIAALRSLAQGVRDLYHTVALWIENLLTSLGVLATPPLPPVERTYRLRTI